MNAGGFIKGKNLSELFQQLCTATPTPRLTDLHTLSWATNIIDNGEVDFHTDPAAMRLMAIPAAFSPVKSNASAD